MASHAYGSAELLSVDCPAYAKLEKAVVATPDDSSAWTGSVSDERIWLSGFNLFSGPVSERAQLAPDSQSANGRLSTWKLASDDPHGFWLSCDYAQGLARLSMIVPQTASVCTAKQRNQGDPRRLTVRFECR